MQVFGMSLDDVATQSKFAREQSLNFPLLSDPDGSASGRLGVLMADKPYTNRVSVHGGRAASIADDVLRGVTVPDSLSFGARYEGSLAWLNKIGLRQGYTRSSILNLDEALGRGAVQAMETGFHEGVHVWVNRYLPTIWRSGLPGRLPWTLPLRAPARYLEEVAAYGTGLGRSGQPLKALASPLLAPGSLTPAEKAMVAAEAIATAYIIRESE